jgi:hypothetical protein
MQSAAHVPASATQAGTDQGAGAQNTPYLQYPTASAASASERVRRLRRAAARRRGQRGRARNPGEKRRAMAPNDSLRAHVRARRRGKFRRRAVPWPASVHLVIASEQACWGFAHPIAFEHVAHAAPQAASHSARPWSQAWKHPNLPDTHWPLQAFHAAVQSAAHVPASATQAGTEQAGPASGGQKIPYLHSSTASAASASEPPSVAASVAASVASGAAPHASVASGPAHAIQVRNAARWRRTTRFMQTYTRDGGGSFGGVSGPRGPCRPRPCARGRPGRRGAGRRGRRGGGKRGRSRRGAWCSGRGS